MGNWGIRNLGKKWEFWEKNGIFGENGTETTYIDPWTPGRNVKYACLLGV